jgi:hypothetical protein
MGLMFIRLALILMARPKLQTVNGELIPGIKLAASVLLKTFIELSIAACRQLALVNGVRISIPCS